jgi:hypothetical protein
MVLTPLTSSVDILSSVFDGFAWNHTDNNDEAPVVKLMKSSIFSYEQAWHRLVALYTVYLIARPGIP